MIETPEREASEFEIDAVALKETETALFIMKIGLANEAVRHDEQHRNENPPPRLARWLAHLWGRSAQTVKTLARIFETFTADEIAPNIPLSLWNAVMETDDPAYALHLATDYEFRRQELGEEFAETDKEGIWSSARLRRFYDIKKGRHYASDKVEANVPVVEWDVLTGRFAVTGLPISGNKPSGLARVTVREVLDKGE